MRHHSKLHISGREFTKKLRFNNNDYILTSVFDGGEDFDFDKEWELAQRKKNRRRMLRPHADYAYPMFESLFDDIDDILNNDDDIFDDSSDYESVYFDMDVIGSNSKEIYHSSKSRFVNWAFERISKMFIIANEDKDKIERIDDFIQKTASYGNQNEYKIKLKQIFFDHKTGELRFVLEHIDEKPKNGNDMIFKMYIDNEHNNIGFSLYWEGQKITYTRLKDLVYINKDLMESFIKTNSPYDNDTDEYRYQFTSLMNNFMNNKINCTVCRRKSRIVQPIESINAISLSDVPKIFSVVGKYGRETTGNIQTIEKIINYEVNNRNLSDIDATDDDYYVIISGNNEDKFVRSFMTSYYKLEKHEFMYAIYDKKTTEKLFATQKLYCLIMPFSKLINALKRFLLFTTTGE